jgi:hypothetical protein
MDHAATSRVSVSMSPILLPVHSMSITLISISAALSQLAWFGVFISASQKSKLRDPETSSG